MRKHLKLAAVVGTAAFLASVGGANASLTITPQIGVTGGPLTDTWTAEAGQSIPTGTGGYVGGTLVANDAGAYTFTYGPTGLVAGATGFGNSTNLNEFWVGSS